MIPKTKTTTRCKEAHDQPNPTVKGTLSVREFEVLRLIANGCMNHEIAAALGIKERTVRFHVENILFRLGVKNRTEAAHVAFQEGWLAEDEI